MIIAKDKILHFSACFLVSLLLELIIPESFKPDVVSVSFTSGLAVGKEVGDYMNYGRKMPFMEFAKMSGADLVADGLGIAAGTCLGLTIRNFWT